jgi:hypothetical protein
VHFGAVNENGKYISEIYKQHNYICIFWKISYNQYITVGRASNINERQKCLRIFLARSLKRVEVEVER